MESYGAGCFGDQDMDGCSEIDEYARSRI